MRTHSIRIGVLVLCAAAFSMPAYAQKEQWLRVPYQRERTLRPAGWI